jgi:hypothetical protein
MMTVVFEFGGKENETRTRIAYNTSNTFNTTLLITSLCAATATNARLMHAAMMLQKRRFASFPC